MKIKIKLSIEQLMYLVQLLEALLYDNVTPTRKIEVPLDKMQSFNLKAFMAWGYKKIIDNRANPNYIPETMRAKQKTMSIDINHLQAIMYVLDYLDLKDPLFSPYYIAMHQDLIAQQRDLPTIKKNY